MSKPACALCYHSIALEQGRAVQLVCCFGAESVDEAARVQRWWSCVHFEREPGAEGDAA